MSEKIYVLNENGDIAGLKDRDDVHMSGTLHSAMQCWVMNNKGEVLVQRRAPIKDKSAGKWDVSFGGHCAEVPEGKDILMTNVIKEGHEELGLTLSPQDIIKLGEVRYTSQENKNREILGIFLVHVGEDQRFTFEDGEVSEVKWIMPEQLYYNIIHKPKEYANRLGAVTILKFYSLANG